ncbi:dihydrofolate reductase family protein [Chelativorans sp. M5D2P16]|uniref:dihydrofolate reductase family protein n=1 Tax=Chelativorans sp. M5D2P16 TaxID=3095678 RepID=UPI002ACA857B|nr:dihydrofolate reductase family protein [Chelativorans sp. M5D2P16]MDZ5696706.1 dihydrofolate reductase family protein [Chelativorans sp. M5D2P16]
MRVVILNFLSLDGVYQGPGSPDEDRSDGFERGGWFVPFVDAALESRVEEWAASATGFLFGRRTYEEFSAVWPTITDPADRNAARLNSLPKYVAATSPVDTTWGPATVLDHDVGAAVAALKQDGSGELQVHGSGRLGRSLLAANLVDELRIAIAPVIVGQGRKLFGDTEAPSGFKLLSEDRTPSGLIMCRLESTGGGAAGTYVRGQTNLSVAGAASD